MLLMHMGWRAGQRCSTRRCPSCSSVTTPGSVALVANDAIASPAPTLGAPSMAGMAVSNDGSLLVTISRDHSVKVFDVAGFDMVLMLRLPFVPRTAEWIYRVRRS